jgi:hypothetical protein
LTEVSFEFDQAGEIIDCTGTINDGGNIDRNYAGSGLALVRDGTPPIHSSTNQRNDIAISKRREAASSCGIAFKGCQAMIDSTSTPRTTMRKGGISSQAPKSKFGT